MTTETQDVQIAARVSPTLYSKIVEHQKAVEKLTGIEPSISEIVRLLVERGLESSGFASSKKKKR